MIHIVHRHISKSGWCMVSDLRFLNSTSSPTIWIYKPEMWTLLCKHCAWYSHISVSGCSFCKWQLFYQNAAHHLPNKPTNQCWLVNCRSILKINYYTSVHLPLTIWHFHSSANFLAKSVFPDPGFPRMMKHVGFECRKRSSACQQKKNSIQQCTKPTCLLSSRPGGCRGLKTPLGHGGGS